MVNSYIELLTSPKFWILTVALGLAIGVAANFLTRFVERALGTSGALLQGFFRRSRNKREARAKEISDWIDDHEHGAVIVLIEANHANLYGLVMIIVVLICCFVGIMIGFDKIAPLKQLPVLLLLMLLGLVGAATLMVGGRLREVVRTHARGLQGLFPDKSSRKKLG
jgi:hypothetical protein